MPIPDSDSHFDFATVGDSTSSFLAWYAERLREAFLFHLPRLSQGSASDPGFAEWEGMADLPPTRLLFNLCDIDRPRPVHRRGQGTFVATIVEGRDSDSEVMPSAYPLLVRSLANLVIYNVHIDGTLESHFITLEQGHYVVRHSGNDDEFFQKVFERVQPLACSHLVINNEFTPDLSETLRSGDEHTAEIAWGGKQLDTMGLLPAPFPIDKLLSERDLRHVKRLYGIGGLSYGNLSARAVHDPRHFWMSASGVDKGRLDTVGRDILLVTGYERERLMMHLSVLADVEPRRVSVDAIEHFLIYREHPSVGAIVHIHAWWIHPIASTEINYPCGTSELAVAVAEHVRQAPDPSRAVIGLKNHGLTITGHSIREIFERIEGMIIPQVPMS